MSDTHWRNSMKPARFFFMDARAAVPFVITLLHLRWYTLCLAAITTLIFYIMETRGLNFVAALRAFRVWLVTRKRPAVTHSNHTRLVDYGFEPAFERMRMDDSSTAKPVPKMVNKKSSAANQKATQKTNRTAAKTVKPKPKPKR